MVEIAADVVVLTLSGLSGEWMGEWMVERVAEQSVDGRLSDWVCSRNRCKGEMKQQARLNEEVEVEGRIQWVE